MSATHTAGCICQVVVRPPIAARCGKHSINSPTHPNIPTATFGTQQPPIASHPPHPALTTPVTPLQSQQHPPPQQSQHNTVQHCPPPPTSPLEALRHINPQATHSQLTATDAHATQCAKATPWPQIHKSKQTQTQTVGQPWHLAKPAQRGFAFLTRQQKPDWTNDCRPAAWHPWHAPVTGHWCTY